MNAFQVEKCPASAAEGWNQKARIRALAGLAGQIKQPFLEIIR